MSNRQLEQGIAVLRLVARGMAYPQVAAALSIAPETVKKRLSRLYQLLGAVNAAHAIVVAGVERHLSAEDLRAAAAVRRPGWTDPRGGGMSDWLRRATCRAFPDLFFGKDHQKEALHICRYHCPVARDCHAATRDERNIDLVVGGVAYGDNGQQIVKHGGPGDVDQHNPYCRALNLKKEA